MRVLSKKEAFILLEKKFSLLKPLDVIDVCHGTKRHAALVTQVSHEGRNFSFIPLDRKTCSELLSSRVPLSEEATNREVTVSLPRTEDEQHPMWNTIQEQGT